MGLNSLFQIAKQPKGVIKQLDQFLLQQGAGLEDGDRKSVCNSPSSSLGCCRANYYQRQGIQRDVVEPRLRRIFDNGTEVHNRLQRYFHKMGLLLMDEVPLINDEYEIQGHTDGIITLTGNPSVCEILEIKSINTHQFSKLKEPKLEHRAQAQVYIFCSEHHRKLLQEKYPTHAEFKKSEFKRRLHYRKYYLHLKTGSNYTRSEKIRNKVNQHIQMDNILYNVTKPITKAVVLYEDKNTQDMKEFLIELDNTLMDEVLEKFKISNEAWEKQELPCRECKSKSEGRWCSYVRHCFE